MQNTTTNLGNFQNFNHFTNEALETRVECQNSLQKYLQNDESFGFRGDKLVHCLELLLFLRTHGKCLLHE